MFPTPEWTGDPTELLRRRTSTPARLLRGPAPDDAVLAELVTLAMRVPDHGKLEPWRILLLRGPARDGFTDWLMARRAAMQPPPGDAVIAKEREKYGSAPVVLAVISRIGSTERIPEIEQQLSGGALCFALLLAAEALGLGAQWLTGWPAYDPGVAEHLGLAGHERLLGFIHLGQRSELPPERLRPQLAERFSEWAGR